VLCVISLMDLIITHIVLIHEITVLCLDALVMAHVLIMVIVSRVGLVFLLEGLTFTLSRDIRTVHVFPHFRSHPTQPNGEVQNTVKTSSGHMISTRLLRFISLTAALSHRPFLILCR
jgi:hypothetical protein